MARSLARRSDTGEEGGSLANDSGYQGRAEEPALVLCQDRAVTSYPSMKARALQRVLEREPLAYSVHRRNGSHRVMRAPGRPQILFSYHDGATVPPGVVRKILTQDVGLTDEEALALLG